MSVSRNTAPSRAALPSAGMVFSTAIASGSSSRSASAPGRRQSATVVPGRAASSRNSAAYSPIVVPGTRVPARSSHHGIRPRASRSVQRSPVRRSANGKIGAPGPAIVSAVPIRRR